MTIHEFINHLRLKPADAVILQKKFFGMLDHYVIYLGLVNYVPQFVANYMDGVRIIPNHEIAALLQMYVPTNVDRFPGPEHQRTSALQRAFSKIGERAYNLVANNCEHFKNFVHHGIEKSSQVDSIGKGLAVGGVVLAAVGAETKNSSAVGWGIALTTLGLLAVAIENSKSK